MRLILLVPFLFVIFSCSNTPVLPQVHPVELDEGKKLPLFQANSSLTWVHGLAKTANCVVKLSDFRIAVARVSKFDYSTDNGREVLAKLEKHPGTVIRTYATKNPWSKVVATTYLSNKTDIYLNLRKNPRAIASMVNTAVHETLHNAGYGHGDNNSFGKENSVPYKVGSIAEKYVDQCN